MDTLPWWNLWNTRHWWSADESFKWFLHLGEFLFFSLLLFLYCYTQFIRTCKDHRRLFVFAFRDNLVPNANIHSCIHISCSIYNLNSKDRTVARQLNFNHCVVKVQTQNKSAVKWVVLVTCVFLLCSGIFLRCSLLFLACHKCSNDFHYKITQQVINSGINRKVYAFFKRDIKQECGRLLFKKRCYLTAEWFRRKKNISWWLYLKSS